MIEKLKQRKLALEESLNHCKVALAHDDYAKPFVFKRMDRMHEGLVTHHSLKKMVKECVAKNIGFDPSLALQHIEHEALNQFNTIALENIKGNNIPSLMEMRHELELLMLRDQLDHYTRELEKAEKNLLEAITGVTIDEPVIVQKKKKSK